MTKPIKPWLHAAVGQPARIREMAAQDGVKRVLKIARNQCPKFAKYAMLNGCMSCLAICDGDVPAFGTQVRLAADPAHLHFFDADGQALRPVEVLSP